MKKTISIRIGRGSISHNNRKFVAKNVDESRVKDNIIICRENLKRVYDELFGAALDEYNAKQKRKDRCIENYLAHITNGKQEKPFYELVFQIGNKDDTPCGTPDAETAANILQEYYSDFLKRNPHIKVFNAVIHLDEATPHLHVDFVPFATGQSRGLSTRNSLNKALEQQGFSAKTNLETPAKQWTDFEKQRLAEVMLKCGIEWEQLGTHNEHLSVLDYKKQERAKEVAELENKAKSIIVRYNSEISEKRETLAQNQTLLEKAAEKVTDIQNVDAIQTKKTLFGDNITVSKEDYNKLSTLAKKQIAAENKESELTSEISMLKKEKEELVGENKTLREKLREESQSARSLRLSFSALQRELDGWKQKYKRVVEFIEKLGLKDKLEKFLHPNTQVKKR